MSKPTPSCWSDSLREQTRAALESLPLTPDGRVHMKHRSEGYGWFEVSDLLAGRLVLRCKGRDTTLGFASIDAIIAAGWAID
ncbi:hypothetical protein [Dokdonella sp.]|uniref:hypothetical protein n=1 Tax=Dokdonella sp. TaxID=2291710 RepID=UPI0031C5142A|nr:hypothetical protein [Dokdonella sp.]